MCNLFNIFTTNNCHIQNIMNTNWSLENTAWIPIFDNITYGIYLRSHFCLKCVSDLQFYLMNYFKSANDLYNMRSFNDVTFQLCLCTGGNCSYLWRSMQNISRTLQNVNSKHITYKSTERGNSSTQTYKQVHTYVHMKLVNLSLLYKA